MIEKVYYVYRHIDPRDESLVYIGKGKAGRAWDVTRCRGYNRRHQKWMIGLIEEGFLPCDWVEIIKRNLTEKEAFSLEKELTHNQPPLPFNSQSGQRQYQSKLTDNDASDIYVYGKFGTSPSALSKLYEVSRATIHMIISDKQWRSTNSVIREILNGQ